MSSSKVKIALIQHKCGPNKVSNLEKWFQLSYQAVKEGAHIICSQELFSSSYFCQTEDPKFFELSESVDGPTISSVVKFAKQYNVVVVASFFERCAPGLYYNSAVVIDGVNGLVGHYRKLHIPHDPQFFEKYYFAPGDLPIRAFDTQYSRIAVLICWDQWFPEGARAAALQGAHIIFYPTAIGWLPTEKEGVGEKFLNAWRVIHQSHAIANGIFVAAVNRVGFESINKSAQGIYFWGHSLICGPGGEILAEGPEDEEAIVMAELNLQIIEQIRCQWPFLRDRRPDMYEILLKRYYK